MRVNELEDLVYRRFTNLARFIDSGEVVSTLGRDFSGRDKLHAYLHTCVSPMLHNM